MQTQLQIIKNVLNSYSAFSFAEYKLNEVKKGVANRNEDYYEHMYSVYSGADGNEEANFEIICN